MSNLYESLHTHTVISDGKFTHLDILNMAPKYNIGIVAFTDHDILPDKKILKVLEKNRNHQTKWIIGAEFTSNLPKELNKKKQTRLHILGLFLDPFNKDLRAYSDHLLFGRVIRIKKRIKHLQDLGFDISYKDCSRTSPGAITAPHLVKALMNKEKNVQLIDLWVKKMSQESQNNLAARKIHQELLKTPKIQYPYLLFKSQASQSGDQDNPYLLDLDKTVSLIRGAGGIASLAHWTFTKEVFTLKDIEKMFRENRLDGGEIVFGSGQCHAVNREITSDMRLMNNLIITHKKIPTGGPDMHLEEDLAYFSSRKLLREKTIGLTQNIIDKTNVNIKFSSL